MRYFYLICLLLFNYTGTAQVLKGVVVDDQHKPLVSAIVTNISTQETVYTDQYGRYSLGATVGDKINFFAFGYKNIQRTVPPAINIAQLNVTMSPLSYELKESVVTPYDLTPFQKDSIERKRIYGDRIQEEVNVTHIGFEKNNPLAVNGLVSGLVGAITGQTKRWKNFQKEYKYFESQRFIDTRYTTDLVTRLTGLTGDTEAHFMNSYPMPYDFSRAATELELDMWIRNNYKKYLNKIKDSTDTQNGTKP